MAESDFERIDLDPALEEVRYEQQKPDFAQVIFHNIAEMYPTDAHIVCDYKITAPLVITTRDYVGLYRVGWGSSRDYVCFQLSPMPSMYQPGEETSNRVVFQAPYLPKDDGEFYQFCYVSGKGYVRGASTPFQFKKPQTDDYIEVEEDDMMMVKPATTVLLESLNAATTERTKLEKQLKVIECERDSLLTKIVECEKKVTAEQRVNEALEDQLTQSQDRVAALEKERAGLANLHDSLRVKLDAVTQEKNGVEKKLEEKDEYISSLQEKIKNLISEKDALTGRNKSLEQEKELFKNHFTSTESTVQKYMTTIEDQAGKLCEQTEMVEVLTDEVQRLREGLTEQRQKTEVLTAAASSDLARLGETTENLRHAEDKLSASDAMVSMMKKETLAQTQVIAKMSVDLEESKTEAFNLKSSISRIEKDHKTEKTRWLDEKADLQATMKAHEKELEHLWQKVETLSEQAQVAELKTETEQGSLFALQTAQTHLRERFAKMKAEYAEMKKANESLTKKLRQHQQGESDLCREVTDLKDRLSMGAEEYKTKYLEARKLESEIRRLTKQLKRSVSLSVGPSEDSSTDTEKVQTASPPKPIPTRAQSVDAGTETTGSCSPRVQTSDVGTFSRVKTTDVGTTARLQMSDAGTVTRWPGLAVAMPPTPPPTTPPATPPTAPSTTPPTAPSANLEKAVEELTKEVAVRKEKQNKYKQLYHDEKQKIAFLQKHYYGELEKKDDENTDLKRRHEDKCKSLQDRITTLQQIIDRQKTHIEQLRTTATTDTDEPQKGQVSALPTASQATPPPLTTPPPLRMPHQLATPPLATPPVAPPTHPTSRPVQMPSPLQTQPAPFSHALFGVGPISQSSPVAYYPHAPPMPGHIIYPPQTLPADSPFTAYPAHFNPFSPAYAQQGPPTVIPPLRYGNPYERPFTYPPQHVVLEVPEDDPSVDDLDPSSLDHDPQQEDENNNQCSNTNSPSGSVTPPSPSSLQVDTGAAAAAAAVVRDLDPLVADDAPPALETPLKPLPAPIQPTVLPSAKVAEIKCLNSRNEGLNMLLNDSSDSSDDEGPPPLESAEAEEERFHDADGEPQKLCPACNMTFPADYPQHVFEDHVDGHYGPVCPMCHQQFETDVGQEFFENHVQAHFRNDEDQ